MHAHPDKLVMVVHRAAESDFRRLARRWRSTRALLRKTWRFKESELREATAMVRCHLEGIERTRANSPELRDVFVGTESMDGLWSLFLTEATPGTRMWRQWWKAQPRIQRLTITDMLVALASVKVDMSAEVLMRPISRNTPDALSPEFALALAAGHLDAAEEALRVVTGLSNVRSRTIHTRRPRALRKR